MHRITGPEVASLGRTKYDARILELEMKPVCDGWLVRVRGISISSYLWLHISFLNSDATFYGKLDLGQNENLPADVYKFPHMLSDKTCLTFSCRHRAARVLNLLDFLKEFVLIFFFF